MGAHGSPLQGRLIQYVTNVDLSAARLNAVIDQLEAGVVPPNQIYHLHYRDLVTDPMATVAALHRHFGIPISDAGRAGIANTSRSTRATPVPHIDSPSARGTLSNLRVRRISVTRITSES